MARHIYSEINLHITWHVKQSRPIINSEIETRLHKYIRNYALQSTGVKLKGASSHYVNHGLVNRKLLDWQTGYGVVTFGTKDLEWVVRYVQNQKAHHAQRSTVDRLERIEDEEAKADSAKAR
jgi:REP element-mobilizing transposase RayT